MATFNITFSLHQTWAFITRFFLVCTMILSAPLYTSAQNINIAGGGVTIAAGSSLTVQGSLTLGTAATVSNSSTIRLTGNWTNNGGTYAGSGGTVIFRGAAAQLINGTSPSHTFNNVIINQSVASTVDMNGNLNVAALTFTNGKISIGGNTLTITGAVTNTVSNGLKGGSSSSVTIGSSNNAGTLSFDQTIAGTSNVLRNLTLGNNSAVVIGNKLDITAGTTTIPGTLTLASGSTLNTGDLITLKSAGTGTSRLAEIPVSGAGTALATINGKVTVERFISSRRAWRLICVPLQNTGAAETSIWNAFQEGINNTIDLTTGGSYATDNKDASLGFGTHVTSDRGIYNSTTDGFDGASRFNASLLYHNGTDWGGRPLNTKNTYVTSKPGWMLFVRGSRAVNLSLGIASPVDVTVIRTKGLLNTGSQTTITNTNPSGYNIIGNPFASAIDLTKCTLDGTAISSIGYYLWDPYILGTFTTVGGYTYYDPVLGFLTPPVSSVSVNRIESGSAFFVPSIGGQSLIIPEAAKVANNSLVLRPSGTPGTYQSMKTSLFIDNDGQSAQADACGQVMHGTFSNEFSSIEDRLKMNNFSENLSILNGSTRVIMEYRKPYAENDTVFFAIGRMGVKKYHFVFEPGNMTNLNLLATLEDQFTGAKTPVSLKQNTIADFTVTSDTLSSAADRFRLVFKKSKLLPFEFEDVKAYLFAGNIKVQWTIQNDRDIREYQVEKSNDKREFVKINTTIPLNSNGDLKVYSCMDAQPGRGVHFYRVRIVFADGSSAISQVVEVNVKEIQAGFSIYPNPVTNGTIQLEAKQINPGMYKLELINSNGQIVLNARLFFDEITMHSLKINGVIARGVYQLRITGADKISRSIKLQVQTH